MACQMSCEGYNLDCGWRLNHLRFGVGGRNSSKIVQLRGRRLVGHIATDGDGGIVEH